VDTRNVGLIVVRREGGIDFFENEKIKEVIGCSEM